MKAPLGSDDFTQMDLIDVLNDREPRTRSALDRDAQYQWAKTIVRSGVDVTSYDKKYRTSPLVEALCLSGTEHAQDTRDLIVSQAFQISPSDIDDWLARSLSQADFIYSDMFKTEQGRNWAGDILSQHLPDDFDLTGNIVLYSEDHSDHLIHKVEDLLGQDIIDKIKTSRGNRSDFSQKSQLKAQGWGQRPSTSSKDLSPKGPGV